MSCRISALAISASLLAVGANAQVVAAATTPQPAAGCNTKTAKLAQINVLATNPKSFSGKCVKLKGFWRDTGVYPTAAEANQPDALSVAFLDHRRIGLYLSAQDGEHMPHAPVEATLVGTAGDCASLGAPGSDSTIGYCHYKSGAYLAVAGIDRAK